MNHDRMSENKSVENTAEAAKLISYLLNLALEGVVVAFDSNMVVDDSKSIRYMIMHGDLPIDKAPGQSVAWEYGDSEKFNVIMTAHTHAREQKPKDDGLRFRKDVLPAFCPIDSYGKTVAHGNLPGIRLIFNTKDDLPVVTDYPLHYD